MIMVASPQASMRAAIVVARGLLRLDDVPIPGCRPDTMIVKVEACAICGSDVRIYRHGDARAKYPVIIGHEIAGIVADVGREVVGYSVGDRVCVAPGIGCGECKYCKGGHSNVCINPYPPIGYALDGGFAQYMEVPPNVIRLGYVNGIPEGVSFEHASISEVIACCLNGLENCPVHDGDVVLIFGAGPAGCILSILAKTAGARRVLMTQRSLPRLEAASRRLGTVDRVIPSLQEDLEAAVMEETEGRGADVVYVCAPSAESQKCAISLADGRGRILFFGGLPKDRCRIVVNSNLIHYKELLITGASSSLARHNKDALRLIASGRIDAGRLITHTLPLEAILEGMRLVEEKAAIKVVVRPSA